MTYCARQLVREVVKTLRRGRNEVWLFGGWAEELRSVRDPGAHADVDLLLRASDFTNLEAFVAKLSRVTEIREKRFSHKRAYAWKGVRVELLLVHPGIPAMSSLFDGRFRLEWPADTFTQAPVSELPVASTAALAWYRRQHASVLRAHAAFRASHASGSSL